MTSIRRRAPRPGFFRVATLLALLIAPAGALLSADIEVMIEHPLRPDVGGPARLLSPDKALSQTFTVGPGAPEVQTADLQIARRLGRIDTGLEANGAWFTWRSDFAAGTYVKVDLRVDVPVGSGGKTQYRSFWLVDAWPKSYRVIQRESPQQPPASGGKADATVFEEVLVISFKYLSSTQP